MDSLDNRLSLDYSGIGDYPILIKGYTIWHDGNFQSAAIALIVNCYNF
jgi:hypothetical protein